MDIFEINEEIDMYHPNFAQEENFPFSWEAPFLFDSLLEEKDEKEEREAKSKSESDTGLPSTLLPANLKSEELVFHDLVNIELPVKDEKSEAPAVILESSENELSGQAETLKEEHKNIPESPNTFNFEVDVQKDYIEVVDEALRNADQIGSELSYRRDVVNKYILRSFRKTISKLFRTKFKRPSRSSKPFNVIKEQLLDEAANLGIIANGEQTCLSSEFKEFVCWMAISKMTHRAKPLFNYKNQAIKVLSDILSNYSHSKLNSVYKNRHIARIFKYYIENCLQSSLSHFPEHKQIIYTKAAVDIFNSFY